MSSQTRWIIFDGDNTLWNVEALYDDARSSLGRLLESDAATAAEVERFQRDRDAELHRSMGYSAARFPRSFKETAEQFVNHDDPRITEALHLAEAVFTRAAEPAADVDIILERLARSHQLALLTAGQKDIQERRLEHFGRRHHFSAVRIVERKDRPAISSLLQELGANPAESWMVGDSLRSDIVPAVAAGLGAIHLQTVNWHEVEVAGTELPPSALTARSLQDAEALIVRSLLA